MDNIEMLMIALAICYILGYIKLLAFVGFL